MGQPPFRAEAVSWHPIEAIGSTLRQAYAGVERFRLDVLALACGDEEESECLTATCLRRDYTMYDWGFTEQSETAREMAMLAYMGVAGRLDKINMIGAFRACSPI